MAAKSATTTETLAKISRRIASRLPTWQLEAGQIKSIKATHPKNPKDQNNQLATHRTGCSKNRRTNYAHVSCFRRIM